MRRFAILLATISYKTVYLNYSVCHTSRLWPCFVPRVHGFNILEFKMHVYSSIWIRKKCFISFRMYCNVNSKSYHYPIRCHMMWEYWNLLFKNMLYYWFYKLNFICLKNVFFIYVFPCKTFSNTVVSSRNQSTHQPGKCTLFKINKYFCISSYLCWNFWINHLNSSRTSLSLVKTGA